MTTGNDDKSPDETGGTTKETGAAAGRESRARWIVPLVVVPLVVGALVPIALALINRDPEPAPTPPANTSTAPVPSPRPTPDPTIPPTPQPTDPVNPPSPAAPGPSPAYLTDLDYSAGYHDDYVEAGLASITGKRYKKSFRVKECLSPEIAVVLPTGLTQLSGVVGYDDESSYKERSYKVQIEETSNADPTDKDAQFTRLNVLTIPSGGRRAVPFTEQLSLGTTGIRLSAVKYSCGTTVAWGDPRVS
jgi:hypothetical protein